MFIDTRPKCWPLDENFETKNKSIEAERAAEQMNDLFAVNAKNQIQYNILDGSQQSTTAGETSADEEMLELRLSQPGLTMQGIFTITSDFNFNLG